METIRVIIADDHPITIAGYSAQIELMEGIEVVATTADGAEVLGLVQEHKPDILLLDFELPNLTGGEISKALKAEKSTVRVVIVSAFDYPEYVYSAMRNGASAYVKKEECDVAILQEAIKAVMSSTTLYVSPLLAQRMMSSNLIDMQASGSAEELSKRELEILFLVARGHLNSEIARQTGVAQPTVKNHIDNIRKKLGISTRNELLIWVSEHKAVLIRLASAE